jgi:hypothetical protein
MIYLQKRIFQVNKNQLNLLNESAKIRLHTSIGLIARFRHTILG